MEKEKLLKKLGEETLYSAKGHFKSSDLRRMAISSTIWTCAILNILALIGIDVILDKWISALALLGVVSLLIWNQGEGKNYRQKHKKVGERYLAIHKEIRSSYFLKECSKSKVQALSEKVRNQDKSEKPDIPWLARKWAQLSISKFNETDNWFLE